MKPVAEQYINATQKGLKNSIRKQGNKKSRKENA
jgi:hypothetical protein